jgi:hypothetical protein
MDNSVSGARNRKLKKPGSAKIIRFIMRYVDNNALFIEDNELFM